jgi:ribosomal protein S18 acetylase RimI-like enzyme
MPITSLGGAEITPVKAEEAELTPISPSQTRLGDVLIREGSDSDAEFFFDMEERTTWESLPRSCGTNWDREIMREALCATHRLMLHVPGNTFFIAEVECETGRERAGLLWFGPRRNLITGEDEGWIFNITVEPQFRGYGLAKLLIRHAEEYALRLGYRVVGLSVATHNSVARGLYDALGYSEHTLTLRKPLSRDGSGALDISALEDPINTCAVCREEGQS